MGINPNKFLRIWFPLAFYSGIIFYISSLPNIKVPLGVRFSDKLVHFLEYIPFGFLLARAMWQSKASVSRKVFLAVVFWGTLAYALSDEFHQSFVAGRESTLADALADTIGGFMGGWLYVRNKTF